MEPKGKQSSTARRAPYFYQGEDSESGKSDELQNTWQKQTQEYQATVLSLFLSMSFICDDEFKCTETNTDTDSNS